MKIARVIYAEQETRPDGTIATVCQLMSPYDVADYLEDGYLDSAYVEGLNENSIIGEGCTIMTPQVNYVAWADNTFSEAGTAYNGDPPAWYDDGSKGDLEPLN